MYYDLYDYDHPALYKDLVERGACTRARRMVCSTSSYYKRAGARRLRRAIKRYLRHDDEPRIDNMAAGDSREIW